MNIERRLVNETPQPYSSADILDIYAKIVHEFNYLTDQTEEGPPLLPKIVIRRLQPRADENQAAIQKEAENISGLDESNGITSGILIPSSAHTPQTAKRSKMVQVFKNVTGKTPEFRFPQKRINAHLTGWVWGPEQSAWSLAKIAELNDQQREPFISAITWQMRRSAEILQQLTGVSPKTAYKQNELYFVSGFTPENERWLTTLAQGIQTNETFHFHSSSFPISLRKIAQLEDVSIDDALKHLGPLDTIWHRIVRVDAVKIIRDIAKNRLADSVGFRISPVDEPAVRSDRLGVADFQGYSLKFDRSIPSAISIQIAMDIQKYFEHFQQETFRFYNEYYKNYTDKLKRNQIIQEFINYAESMGFQVSAGELSRFIFGSLPTYGQLLIWIDELQSQSQPDVEFSKQLAFLTRFAHAYEKMYSGLLIPQGKSDLIRSLIKRYSISYLSAEMLYRIIIDTYRPREDYKEVKFNAPAHFSWSCLFAQYEITPDDLLIHEMSVATRQEKGVVEDVAEVVIARDKPL